MHHHVCKHQAIYLILDKQIMFFLYYIPRKELNVWENFNNYKKSLLIFYLPIDILKFGNIRV
jgi:hypothetical protein